MTYWTVMLITALGGGYMDGGSMALAYRSLAECEAATAIVSGTLGYDHKVSCIESGVASSSIRPLRRPGVHDG